MKLRASSVAAIFTGTDGLTDKQSETLKGLLSKVKLTEKQAITRDELIAKRDAPIELPEGAKTHIEEIVNQELWGYKKSFGSKQTDKGTTQEDEAIDIYNQLFLKAYKKADISLALPLVSGHPDIVDEEDLKVVDIKCSWDKSTFPKLPRHANNSTYEWQVKMYLYMLRFMTKKDWRKGEIAYVLVNTPEGLLNDWDEPSLHFMDELPLDMRVTVKEVELTDDDIVFITDRLEAAEIYATKYRKELCK